MLKMAGGGDNHASRQITVADKADDVFTAKAVDGGDVAADRPAERMVGKEIQIEKIVDVIVGGVLGLRDLLKNDLPLALDLLGIENGMEKDVGQEIDRERQVLIQHFGVVA